MWQLHATIISETEIYSKALADGLATDCEVIRLSDLSFQFDLIEESVKDLRAMWNTRMRGIIACDNVLKELEEIRKG
ncbi:MAG: hypothetical protein VW230_00865 [Candidatus Poseidoniales archaeon]